MNERPSSFDAFIRRLNLRHFAPHELSCRFGAAVGNVYNSAPPPNLWENIAPTLLVLDELRRDIGRPIRVTSSYRAPAYNAAVGGVASSMHTVFSAIDFIVVNGSVRNAALKLLEWRGRRFESPVAFNADDRTIDTGAATVTLSSLDMRPDSNGWTFAFLGGVGFYEGQDFIHLDTRGRNANWQDTPGLLASLPPFIEDQRL